MSSAKKQGFHFSRKPILASGYAAEIQVGPCHNDGHATQTREELHPHPLCSVRNATQGGGYGSPCARGFAVFSEALEWKLPRGFPMFSTSQRPRPREREKKIVASVDNRMSTGRKGASPAGVWGKFIQGRKGEDVPIGCRPSACYLYWLDPDARPPLALALERPC